MSNKQRAKIYRKAAELIADRANILNEYRRFGICWVFKKLIQPEQDIYNGCQKFPELDLFEIPKQAYRWDKTDEDDNKRIIALLLSEQIALNPPTK